MKHKVVGIGIVIVVLLIAAYVVRERFTTGSVSSYQEPAKQLPGMGVIGNAKKDSDPFDVQIVYTDNGFATTSVVVAQGTRIRFLNESKGQEWPASGIHPTHTLYPEKESTDCLGSSFDSCESLAPGEFFDFTFNYVGKWPFHDHLHGYDSGVIIVQ